MSCQKCADGSECDEVHKIGIKISGDNFKEINTEAAAKTVSDNTPQPAKPTKTVTYDNYMDCKVKLGKAAKQFSDRIFTKDTEYKNTLDDVKKYIAAYGAYDKKQVSVPDELYEAFAMAILESISDSNINKLETNQNKMAEQIYKQIKGGIKNIDEDVQIDGKNYHVTTSIMTISYLDIPAGVAFMNVTYSGKTVTLVWVQGGLNQKEFDEQSNRAIAAFCSVLAQLNNDLWKDFMSYYVVDAANLVGVKVTKKNVDKVLEKTEKVIRAMCDKDASKELVSEMGDTAKDLLKNGLIKNGFRDFIKDSFGKDGEEMIKKAEAYIKLKDEFDSFENKFKTSQSSDETLRDYENMKKLLSEFEDLIK